METTSRNGLMILGGLLALGMITAAFTLGVRFKDVRQPGVITVKGLAEKAVQADTVKWDMRVSWGGNGASYRQVLDNLDKRTPKLKAFLLQQGFDEQEIAVNVPSVSEAYKTVRDKHGNTDSVFDGYLGGQVISISSNKLETVQAAYRAVMLLRAEDDSVLFDEPRYLISGLESIKHEMIAAATADARARAAEFVKGSGRKVGAIQSASQGSFNIYSEGGSDNDEDYGGTYSTATIGKSVRLVVTVQYAVD